MKDLFLPCMHIALRSRNVGLHETLVGSVNGNCHKPVLVGDEDSGRSSEYTGIFHCGHGVDSNNNEYQ